MRSKHQKIRKSILFIMFFSIPIIMNVFSPAVIVVSSIKGIMGITFYAWTIVFLSSFFVGRAYCSYICPYGGMQESVYEMNGKELKKSRIMTPIRIGLGIVWLAMIIFFYAKNGITKHELLFAMENGVSVDNIDGIIHYF